MPITINLTSESDSIIHLSKDKRLAKVISMLGPISYTLHEDSYKFLVNTIIGQMLSNKVADIMSERLARLCQDIVCTNTISSLSDDEIKGIGISKSKVSYIRNLTNAIESKEIDFAKFPELSDIEIIKILTSIRGIGNWSAKMYLIFVLNRDNILPFEDGAFLQSYSWLYKTEDLNPACIKVKCKKWTPYASIATRYLYWALDSGLTKKPFHLYKDFD